MSLNNICNLDVFRTCVNTFLLFFTWNVRAALRFFVCFAKRSFVTAKKNFPAAFFLLHCLIALLCYQTMSTKTFQRSIARIKREIIELGHLRPGTLYSRYSVCGKPGCRCARKRKPLKHGPYHYLSYTFAGKREKTGSHLDIRFRWKTPCFRKSYRAHTPFWHDFNCFHGDY